MRLGLTSSLLLLAVVAGLLQAFSVAWPWLAPDALGLVRGQPLWFLQWLSMLVLLLLLRRSRSAWQAGACGWLFAWAWLAASLAWLFVSMHRYGGLPAPAAALAVLVLAAALALYYGFACYLFWRLAPLNQVLAAPLFAACWLLAELARGQWLTGFGWAAVGYTQLDGPLQPLLAWLGVYGVGFLAVLVSAWLASLLRLGAGRRRMAAGAALLVLWLAAMLLPAHQGTNSGALQVTLLQGNIAQDEKFEPASGVLQSLNWYGEQLQNSSGDLVITPETALPVLPSHLPAGYWSTLQQRFADGQQAALVGLPLTVAPDGYSNSALGLRPGQNVAWRYDKQHLVPFGEFIPPFFKWFIDLLHIPLGDFSRGALVQPGFDWRGQRLAISICYENLFSEEMALAFANANSAPTMLVNMSNLGWFGQHLAMDQHLSIARVRALEFDRPFLLATNTGRSAVVNHRGQLTDSLPAHTAAALSAVVQGRYGMTPYAVWASRFGQWPLWWLALAIVGLAIGRRWVVWRLV